MTRPACCCCATTSPGGQGSCWPGRGRARPSAGSACCLPGRAFPAQAPQPAVWHRQGTLPTTMAPCATYPTFRLTPRYPSPNEPFGWLFLPPQPSPRQGLQPLSSSKFSYLSNPSHKASASSGCQKPWQSYQDQHCPAHLTKLNIPSPLCTAARLVAWAIDTANCLFPAMRMHCRLSRPPSIIFLHRLA